MTKAPIIGMDNISAIGRKLTSNRVSLQASNIGIKNAQCITSQYEITFLLEKACYTSERQEQSFIATHFAHTYTGYTLDSNHGELYPCLNFGIAAKSCTTPYPFSSYQAEQPPQYTLSNSLECDSNCSALIFSKV